VDAGEGKPPGVTTHKLHQEMFWLLNRLSEPWNTILGSLKARLGSLRTLRLAKTVRGFLMPLQGASRVVGTAPALA
jgi:hypothetical protein